MSGEARPMIQRPINVVSLVSLALLLSNAARISADDEHRSHVPVSLPANVDPATLFRDRIKQLREQAGLADLLKQFGSNGTMNREQVLKLLRDNPQLGDLVRGLNS